MNAVQISRDVVLEPADNSRLANLCGQFDEHLRQIERRLDVEIASRGNHFRVTGQPGATQLGSDVLHRLFSITDRERLDPERVHILLQESVMREGEAEPGPSQDSGDDEEHLVIQTRLKRIRPRGANQTAYMRSMRDFDLAFGIGPAGTGKTYLAIAAAVDALEHEQVRRIVLVRPAVEAGERLGFLPGDLKEKVDPYMQPLYDSLNDLIPGKQVQKYIEDKRIEIAPLAFMRGRTLSNAFVVLDEAQNATEMQMKMFLTRLGENSRMAVTGDMSQIDLPRGTRSGLVEAERILRGIDGISFVRFTSADVVRHPLVAKIVRAYRGYEDSAAEDAESTPDVDAR